MATKRKLPRAKLHIPTGYVKADDTEKYVEAFDRLNGLKPAPYRFRGQLVDKGRSDD